MIRKLRRKFVCTVMVIVMLMVGVVLGVVIYFTGQNMQTQSISMMQSITAGPFQLGDPGKPANDEVRLPFFTVQISPRGDLVTTGGGYFDLSDKEYIQKIVNLALNSDDDMGELERYDLRYLKTISPRGISIVFADTATEAATMRSLVYSCIIIFFAVMLVFFGISILLSRWAIKPVEKAWTQQRQFVADASHELKTPLAVIMANAELLQNQDASEENQQKFSGNILTMTYQMRSLVENMLEMARVDNGAVKMERLPLDMSQLVSDAVLSFQLLYEEKNMGLVWDTTEETLICGSEQHLYQVLDVLLDNGLKYSARNGTVYVKLLSSGRNCTLSVASPGEQLSKEELKNIFKRFYRVDKAREMNGSYGLGLSIAEAIVKAHKGKIWAESRDGWNTFYVQLPVYNKK